MWGLNILNEESLHEEYYRMSYFYKRVIIYGYVGIRSCGDGPRTQQRNRKPKAPSRVFIFSVKDILIIGIYIISLVAL